VDHEVTDEIVREYIEKQDVIKRDDNFKVGDGNERTIGLLADNA